MRIMLHETFLFCIELDGKPKKWKKERWYPGQQKPCGLGDRIIFRKKEIPGPDDPQLAMIIVSMAA